MEERKRVDIYFYVLVSSTSRSDSDEESRLNEEDSFTTAKMMDDLITNVVL